jgi:hypothetical protein
MRNDDYAIQLCSRSTKTKPGIIVLLMRHEFTALFLSAAVIIGGALGQEQQDRRGLQTDKLVDVDSPWPTYLPTSAARADVTGMPTVSTSNHRDYRKP